MAKRKMIFQEALNKGQTVCPICQEEYKEDECIELIVKSITTPTIRIVL